MPSVSMGSITFAIVRDVDYDIPAGSALLYAKSAEANRTTSAAIVRPLVIPMSCDISKNRQIWYDTTPSVDSDLSEFAQFRILVVINQPPSIVGTTTSTLGMDLFLEYDVEFCGPTGYSSNNVAISSLPPATTYTVASNTASQGAKLTAVTGLSGTIDNDVYLVNPALTLYKADGTFAGSSVPVRSFWREAANSLLMYSNPQQASAAPGFGNINMFNGPYFNGAQTNIYTMGAALAVKGPAFFSDAALTDDDKSRHGDLIRLIKAMTVAPKQVEPAIAAPHPVDALQTSQIADLQQHKSVVTREQAAYNAQLSGIIEHNRQMAGVSKKILTVLGSLIKGDGNQAGDAALEAMRTSASVALDSIAGNV